MLPFITDPETFALPSSSYVKPNQDLKIQFNAEMGAIYFMNIKITSEKSLPSSNFIL